MAGIRTALAAGAVLIAASAAAVFAPAALADQPVVTATIYPGGQGSVSSHTVTLGALVANCPTYSGAAPFTLQPSGQPYQPAQDSAWALATIVSCGLQIPSSAVSDVQVQSVQHGYESPLSWAQLSDPGQYRDTGAPGALPVISVDGSQDQVSYERPLRSPEDANGADGVADSGPVTIAVYENAPPLAVHISSRETSASRAGELRTFTASASTPAGGALAPGALTFAWTFGDGAGSAAAQPAHTFPGGHYFVTVVVTDRAHGLGGTATVPVTVSSSVLSANTDRGGAGRRKSGTSPVGPVHGRGNASSTARPPGSSPPATTRSGGSPKTGTSPATTPVATAPAATAPAATTSAATTRAETTPASATPASRAMPAARPRGASRRSRRRPTDASRTLPAAVRVVRGELIADIVPVAAGASRLAHPASAAASGAAVVRAATQSTNVAGWLAGLAVVGLLGAGAGQELRGRRRRTGLAG